MGSDFGQFPVPDIIFTPENSQQTLCLPIPLINDNLTESSEVFFVSMRTTQEYVVLGPPAQVIIYDTDSELRCLVCL